MKTTFILKISQIILHLLFTFGKIYAIIVYITSGRQMFMGVEIPIVEGGFGDGCKCITDKTVSEIHEIKVIHVRELINKNINRFKEGIDYIDLKRIDQTEMKRSWLYSRLLKLRTTWKKQKRYVITMPLL